MSESAVLIVGAGPTGLMLANLLARLGVPYRIVEKNEGPSTLTKAMVVQSRTLELYDQIGLTAAAHARGVPGRAVNMWVDGERSARIPLTAMGEGLSPHPYAFVLGQDENERILLGSLQAHGGQVEWNTEVTALAQDADGITATLRRGDSTETARFAYACGCDGARSTIRHILGVPFEGGTYDQAFFVADTAIEGEYAHDEVHISPFKDRFFVMFPMRGERHFRFVGVLTPDLAKRQDVTFEDVRGGIESHLPLRVTNVTWFAVYRTHHRVAARFQVGRAFLVGDAAHVHSPVGGQGMNTGLQDAWNIAWKLAMVMHGKANPALLSSYGAEREPNARTLVNTTDRAFAFMVNSDPLVGTLRVTAFPFLMERLLRLPKLRLYAYKRVSMISVNYRGLGISHGKAGGVKAGDRLPWVQFAEGTNFAPLTELCTQLHVYGPVPPEASAWAAGRPEIRLKAFPYSREAANSGFKESAAYLVRPDGYIAYAADRFSAQEIDDYLGNVWGWVAPSAQAARA